MQDLDNIFTIFKNKNDGLYLVYTNLTSFSCYNLIDEKLIITIKNAHDYYIINFRHTYDKNSKKD